MLVVIIGKVARAALVTDNKQLQKTEQCIGVAIARVVFVINDLLHGFARHDLKRFKLYLHHWQAVYQQNDVITMMAVVGVNTELIDDFKLVFAPIFDVY